MYSSTKANFNNTKTAITFASLESHPFQPSPLHLRQASGSGFQCDRSLAVFSLVSWANFYMTLILISDTLVLTHGVSITSHTCDLQSWTEGLLVSPDAGLGALGSYVMFSPHWAHTCRRDVSPSVNPMHTHLGSFDIPIFDVVILAWWF